MPTNPSQLKQSLTSSMTLYKQMTPLQLLSHDPSWLPFQIKPRFENSDLKMWRSMTPNPRPMTLRLKKKIRTTARIPLHQSMSAPCLPLNQPNSLKWFQEQFNIPKPYSQAQSALEEKNSTLFRLLTSQSIHHDGSEDLSHQLTLQSNSRIQLSTDGCQPLLALPVTGSKNFCLPYRNLTTYQHFLD